MSGYKCQGPGVKSLGGFLSMGVLHTYYITYTCPLYPSDKYDLCPNWRQGLKTRLGS